VPSLAPLLLLALLGCLGAGRAAETAPGPPPDRADIAYGPHPRNVLDLWLAKSAKPAPLFVYIHGGGWYQGDKSAVSKDIVRLGIDLVRLMLDHGVSVASINYRYATMAPLPAPVHDAARAIQFLRSRAREWNLDRDRVAAMGTSAGGCTALWLAYHRDLADPGSPDPVARESSRLRAALAWNPQTSIDPKVIVGWVGDEVMNHPMIWRAVGARDRAEVEARYPEWSGLYREFSPINHVGRGAPPVMVVDRDSPLPAADPGAAIHHVMFCHKLKERADSVGATCWVRLLDRPDPAMPMPYDFLLQHLTRP
jgi:acetyl esterase/lipase